MLPPYPSAQLGEIVHKLMDKAHLAESLDQLKMMWDEACANVEQELGAHWTTASLVPLSRTTKSYSLKRQMTLLNVSKNLGGKRSFGEKGTNLGQILREEPIQSKDGIVKGRIDLAELCSEGWVLTDFKSGEVLENADDEEPRVKEIYRLQLLLYAHLLKEAKGISISKAVLKTLDGREYPVELDACIVSRAGCEARELLHELNNHIQNHPLPENLCLPKPMSHADGVLGCVTCLFRPACMGYKDADKQVAQGEFWPRDIWGTIISIKRSTGRMELEIQNNNKIRDEQGQCIEPVIRVDLSDSAGRHPALNDVQKGQTIEVYEYLRCRSRGVAQDGPRTCIYRPKSGSNAG